MLRLFKWLAKKNRARDGSGYAETSASMLFRPVEADSGKPYARAGAGKPQAQPAQKAASRQAAFERTARSRLVNASPDEPQAKAGGSRERVREAP